MTWSRYTAMPYPVGNNTAASKTRQQTFAASSRIKGRSEAICVPQEGQTVGVALVLLFSEVHFSFNIETIFVFLIVILLR
jgi:hypothetical protein